MKKLPGRVTHPGSVAVLALLLMVAHRKTVTSAEHNLPASEVMMSLAERHGFKGAVTIVPAAGLPASLAESDLDRVAQCVPARFWASRDVLVCQLPLDGAFLGLPTLVLKPWRACMTFVNSLPQADARSLRSGCPLVAEAWPTEKTISLYLALNPDWPNSAKKTGSLEQFTGAEAQNGERVVVLFGATIHLYTTPHINRSVSIAPRLAPVLVEKQDMRWAPIPVSRLPQIPSSWSQRGSAGPAIRTGLGGLPNLPDLLDKLSPAHRKVMRSVLLPPQKDRGIALRELLLQLGHSVSLPTSLDRRIASIPLLVSHGEVTAERLLNAVCGATGVEARSIGPQLHIGVRNLWLLPWRGFAREDAAEYDQMFADLSGPNEVSWPVPARELWKVARWSHVIRPADLSPEISSYVASLLQVTAEQVSKENCLYVSRRLEWGPVVVKRYDSNIKNGNVFWYMREFKTRIL